MDERTLNRFLSKIIINQETGCWIWTASTRGGYGYFWYDKSESAHRVSYEHFIGPIPDGLDVLHTCDNKLCVNPEHLFVGTHQDNMFDMSEKGRSTIGERYPNSKLTEESVRSIRQRYDTQYISYSELSKMYNISKAQIGCIIRGENWSHI